MDIEVLKIQKRATKKVCSSEAVYKYASHIKDASREVMAVMLLDSKNGVLDFHIHSIGTVDSSAVYPREIVKQAILKDASGIILVHNHPSGDSEPSIPDKQLTKDVVFGCRFLGLKLLDHLILGNGNYYSFADQGLIEQYEFDALHVV